MERAVRLCSTNQTRMMVGGMLLPRSSLSYLTSETDFLPSTSGTEMLGVGDAWTVLVVLTAVVLSIGICALREPMYYF